MTRSDLPDIGKDLEVHQMRLFDSYPVLEDDLIVIRRMRPFDAPALKAFTSDDEIYRYLPTFLFERKYGVAKDVIRRMDAECFNARESILLGVYLKSESESFIGIAEIYGYEERKPKVSIGYRLDRKHWGMGIATRIVGLLKAYLIDQVKVRTITAHVMPENRASAKVLVKNGFICLYTGVPEDWGFEDPTPTDKYVFKRRWISGAL